MAITPDKILDAIDQEGILNAGKTQAQLQVMEHYVRQHLIPALQALLDLKADPETITRAQLEHARKHVNTDMCDRLADAHLQSMRDQGYEVPQSVLDQLTVRLREGHYRPIVDALDPVVTDMQRWLNSQGMGVPEFINELGLPDDVRRKVTRGQMTVGELLLACPSVIIGMGVLHNPLERPTN